VTERPSQKIIYRPNLCEIEMNSIWAGPEAFLDTAAVIEELDLVITSDTSIAHLAGAMGRETWVALRRVPDWRWLLERENSPWYPSVRLFRQRRSGDWNEVFERIEAALRQRLRDLNQR
jgi:ADP-heptose:LPS heptosyltransferase